MGIVFEEKKKNIYILFTLLNLYYSDKIVGIGRFNPSQIQM